jgi:hypothetical protein
MSALAQAACLRQDEVCLPERMCRGRRLVGKADSMSISGPAFHTYHLSARSSEMTMDVTDPLGSLMRMQFPDIRALPPSASEEKTDSAGRRFRITTWCEHIAPDKYRVIVSIHQMYGLGASQVRAVEGFTIDADSKIERLDSRQLRDLFL